MHIFLCRGAHFFVRKRAIMFFIGERCRFSGSFLCVRGRMNISILYESDPRLLNKVRIVGRLYLWGFLGSWGWYYCYFLLTSDFLNNFFAHPYKIISSKGGPTHHLKAWYHNHWRPLSGSRYIAVMLLLLLCCAIFNCFYIIPIQLI